MKRIVLVWTVSLLAACGSSVKLDNPPVEDRTGAPVTTVPLGDGNKAAGSGVGNGGVKGVELSQAEKDAAMRAAADRIVYFDYDSSAIRPEFQATIENHARIAKADRSKKITLEGHTDERGGREYNLALGQRRAEAVRRALILSGANDSQLEAVSFGKEKPAMAGSTETAMSKNRRVEITYK
jgi:peptidoglycan-associated lipoprotein